MQIPADLVINCVIAAIVVNSNQAPKNFIYHVSSSLRNPLKISDIHNISHKYFMKTPCLDKDGKPIVISKGIALKSMAAFNIYTKTRYVLPLEVCEMLSTFQQPNNKASYSLCLILCDTINFVTHTNAQF